MTYLKCFMKMMILNQALQGTLVALQYSSNISGPLYLSTYRTANQPLLLLNLNDYTTTTLPLNPNITPGGLANGFLFNKTTAIYGILDNPQHIVSVNLQTGGVSLLADLSSINQEAFGIDLLNETIVVFANGSQNIYSLQLQTNLVQLLSNIPGASSLNTLTVGNQNTIYVSDFFNRNVYAVNGTTGAYSLINSSPIGSSGTISYEPFSMSKFSHGKLLIGK